MNPHVRCVCERSLHFGAAVDALCQRSQQTQRLLNSILVRLVSSCIYFVIEETCTQEQERSGRLRAAPVKKLALCRDGLQSHASL